MGGLRLGFRHRDRTIGDETPLIPSARIPYNVPENLNAVQYDFTRDNCLARCRFLSVVVNVRPREPDLATDKLALRSPLISLAHRIVRFKEFPFRFPERVAGPEPTPMSDPLYELHRRASFASIDRETTTRPRHFPLNESVVSVAVDRKEQLTVIGPRLVRSLTCPFPSYFPSSDDRNCSSLVTALSACISARPLARTRLQSVSWSAPLIRWNGKTVVPREVPWPRLAIGATSWFLTIPGWGRRRMVINIGRAPQIAYHTELAGFV